MNFKLENIEEDIKVKSENAVIIQKEFSDLDLTDKEAEAISIILECGGIDGAHHKQWVLDQVVRIIMADRYDEFVVFAKDGEEGPETYGWDVGIAP